MLGYFSHEIFRDLIIGKSPLINNLIIPFVRCDQTHIIVFPHFIYLFLSILKRLLLNAGCDKVSKVEGKTPFIGQEET